MPKNSNTSATALRALKVLETLGAAAAPVSVNDVAASIGADRSTAYRMLMTLLDAGYVTRHSASKGYQLGYKLLSLASPLLREGEETERILDCLKGLAEATGEGAHYCVLDGDASVLVHKVKGTQLVSVDFKVGDRSPLHCSSIGKALLAYQDIRLVEKVIDRGLPKVASRTITDPAAFRAELQTIRRQGYAFDDLEFHDDLRCLAVPIFREDGRVEAGISMSGPSSRFTLARLDELKDKALIVARQLSRRA